MDNDRLTEQEAAQFLGVAPLTLRDWRFKKKQGPRYLKIGHLVRYRKSDLDAFLESSIVDPAQPRPRRGRKAA